jgi:hypothetical protein
MFHIESELEVTLAKSVSKFWSPMLRFANLLTVCIINNHVDIVHISLKSHNSSNLSSLILVRLKLKYSEYLFSEQLFGTEVPKPAKETMVFRTQTAKTQMI